jgi:hypothetical protein
MRAAQALNISPAGKTVTLVKGEYRREIAQAGIFLKPRKRHVGACHKLDYDTSFIPKE